MRQLTTTEPRRNKDEFYQIDSKQGIPYYGRDRAVVALGDVPRLAHRLREAQDDNKKYELMLQFRPAAKWQSQHSPT